MDDIVQRLRAATAVPQTQYTRGMVTEAANEIERARENEQHAIALVSRIRQALGDNGLRMQDELVEWCKSLAAAQKGWQSIETAPEEDEVIVFLSVGAIDIAHQFDGRWWCGSGVAWPPGTVTHWMPLPTTPDKAGG